ncbi:MAG: aromatic-L-amino-acid/L-tryptophan decarboxylase [Thermoanaerobaculia bacterium]|jgi:aromatic-L-amino-acid decarboxylase|nr:aromatic-L-amino-acid/L-tryptophan decarboxylase [Thermoanaerobaculia bacterium]
MTVHPLEPDAAEMHRLVAYAMRRIVAHIESLPSQPASNVAGAAEMARTLIEPLPQSGTPYGQLLDFLFDEAIPRSFNAAGPGYLAYIPGGGIFHAAVADLIADAVNRYVGVFAPAPLLVQIEANVVRWFCEIVGLGPGSGGVLTSGGSLANLTAIIAARMTVLGDNFARATLYCGDQTHHAFQKAAVLAGFPAANIREIPSDALFRVRVDLMADAIAHDRANGFTPFMLCGSAGTTPTGAVDDLAALGQLARAESLWFHVDGAYGAFFMLTQRGREAMRGIEDADSIILDPHKTLFLPFGTGALVVRDASVLRRAYGSHADYLPQFQREDALIDFCEISPELSRDFRGLRVWLPLKLFGIEPFREQLEEKLDLAAWAAAELHTIEGIEVVAEPQLSIVGFRMVKPDADLDALNHELIARINARQRVMLTGATVGGNFVIRICVVSHRTHRDRMEMCLADIRAAVESLRS